LCTVIKSGIEYKYQIPSKPVSTSDVVVRRRSTLMDVIAGPTTNLTMN